MKKQRRTKEEIRLQTIARLEYENLVEDSPEELITVLPSPEEIHRHGFQAGYLQCELDYKEKNANNN